MPDTKSLPSCNPSSPACSQVYCVFRGHAPSLDNKLLKWLRRNAVVASSPQTVEALAQKIAKDYTVQVGAVMFVNVFWLRT